MESVPGLPKFIATPCVRICKLDMDALICTGCGRTRDEVARWTDLDDTTRERIMKELPARMKAAGFTPSEPDGGAP